MIIKIAVAITSLTFDYLCIKEYHISRHVVRKVVMIKELSPILLVISTHYITTYITRYSGHLWYDMIENDQNDDEEHYFLKYFGFISSRKTPQKVNK